VWEKVDARRRLPQFAVIGFLRRGGSKKEWGEGEGEWKQHTDCVATRRGMQVRRTMPLWLGGIFLGGEKSR